MSTALGGRLASTKKHDGYYAGAWKEESTRPLDDCTFKPKMVIIKKEEGKRHITTSTPEATASISATGAALKVPLDELYVSKEAYDSMVDRVNKLISLIILNMPPTKQKRILDELGAPHEF